MTISNAFIYIADSTPSVDEIKTVIYLISSDTGEIIASESLIYSIFGGNEEEISYLVRNLQVYARKNKIKLEERGL